MASDASAQRLGCDGASRAVSSLGRALARVRMSVWLGLSLLSLGRDPLHTELDDAKPEYRQARAHRITRVSALDTWILPVVKRGFALEPRVGLGWSAKRWVTLELGYRASYARYPVGLRFHNIPYFDLRVRW